MLNGRAGQYITIARRSDKDEWFMGCLTADSRTLQVPLDFLDPGRPYRLKTFSTDPANSTQVAVSESDVNNSQELTVDLKQNDGRVFWFAPTGPAGIKETGNVKFQDKIFKTANDVCEVIIMVTCVG